MSSPRTGLEGLICTECHDTGWSSLGSGGPAFKPSQTPCCCQEGQKRAAEALQRANVALEEIIAATERGELALVRAPNGDLVAVPTPR